jgi:hypothetical protein
MLPGGVRNMRNVELISAQVKIADHRMSQVQGSHSRAPRIRGIVDWRKIIQQSKYACGNRPELPGYFP